MDWPYLGQAATPPNVALPDPFREPTEITAGDSIAFTRQLAQFKASEGWSLSYHGRGQAVPWDATSTASGNDHAISILPAVTALWSVGLYTVQGRATNSVTGASQVIYNGTLNVLMNLAASKSLDMRSQNRKILDGLQALMVSTAGSDVLSSSIEGVSFSHMTKTELAQIISFYETKVLNEERAMLTKSGKATGKQIIFRLKR